MKPQWEKRLDLVILIYQWILMEYSNDEVLKIAFEENGFDAEQMKIVEYLTEHINETEKIVSPFLEPSWVWSRMSFFDRAIITEAIAEAKVWQTPKIVIIDQSLITAKKYNIDH